jgi:hypothetical protein
MPKEKILNPDKEVLHLLDKSTEFKLVPNAGSNKEYRYCLPGRLE